MQGWQEQRIWLYDEREALSVHQEPDDAAEGRLLKVRSRIPGYQYHDAQRADGLTGSNHRTTGPLDDPANVLHGRTTLVQRWGAALAERDDWVVLDTETTGLGTTAEIVELTILDPRTGQPLLDTLIRPRRPIPRTATTIHRITNVEVHDAPTFGEVYPVIRQLLTDRLILAYNCAFDERMLHQACQQIRVPALRAHWHCVMQHYTVYHGLSRAVSLSRACVQMGITIQQAHRAYDDCCATYALVRTLLRAAVTDDVRSSAARVLPSPASSVDPSLDEAPHPATHRHGRSGGEIRQGRAAGSSSTTRHPTPALLARVRETHPRAYERWLPAEDVALMAAYQRGISIPALAAQHQRQISSIQARLRKLGLIESEA